ncbi:MAG: TIGR03769 domain-containing protein, partial [Verrucomicrobiota bacterium]
DFSQLDAWNPMDPDRFADSSDKYMKVNLVGVRGPTNGYFSLFQFGAQPTLYLSSFENGIGPEDRFYVTPNSHDHFNWSFSKPGLYEIDFEISTLVDWDPNVPFTVTPVQQGDASLEIVRWETRSCTRYTLESTTNLMASNLWETVVGAEGISSDGSEIVFTNPVSNPATRRYYRVKAGP